VHVVCVKASVVAVAIGVIVHAVVVVVVVETVHVVVEVLVEVVVDVHPADAVGVHEDVVLAMDGGSFQDHLVLLLESQFCSQIFGISDISSNFFNICSVSIVDLYLLASNFFHFVHILVDDLNFILVAVPNHPLFLELALHLYLLLH
jgi:hypothetical protein